MKYVEGSAHLEILFLSDDILFFKCLEYILSILDEKSIISFGGLCLLNIMPTLFLGSACIFSGSCPLSKSPGDT